MLKKYIVHFVVLVLIVGSSEVNGQELYEVKNAEVSFISSAQLEIIEAKSENLVGLLDLTSNKFAFKINMNSFEGFNSSQQQVHFQEKFLETEKYPQAEFEGKTIEVIVDSKSMEQQLIRIKGKLTVHGRVVERMMKILVVSKEDEMDFEARFDIPLVDHDIRIPKIVKYNIAEVINVVVSGSFVPRK